MPSLDLQTVELKIADRIAWVVLNRPDALNAWTSQLGEEMLTALNHAAADPEVRVIVFTGAGRAFSSGADLKAGELGPDGKPDVLGRLRALYNPLILRVRTVEKPVIAAVNGPAVGIGCSLALACDLIVAAESAYFLLAFVNIGLGLDGGASMTLPGRVGHARAFEIAYLGERIRAGQAADWGMINRAVADAELQGAVTELATRLAAGPPARTQASSARSTTTRTPASRSCWTSKRWPSRSVRSHQTSWRGYWHSCRSAGRSSRVPELGKLRPWR